MSEWDLNILAFPFLASSYFLISRDFLFNWLAMAGFSCSDYLEIFEMVILADLLMFWLSNPRFSEIFILQLKFFILLMIWSQKSIFLSGR